MDRARRFRQSKVICATSDDPRCSELRNPLHSFRAIQIGHRVYVTYGYFVNKGHSKIVWVCDLNRMHWAPVNVNDITGLALGLGGEISMTLHSATCVADIIYLLGVSDNAQQPFFLAFDVVTAELSKCELRGGSIDIPSTSGHGSVYVEHRQEILFISVGMLRGSGTSEASAKERRVVALDVGTMYLYEPEIKGKKPKLLPFLSVCSTKEKIFIHGGANIFGRHSEIGDTLHILHVGSKFGLVWSTPTTSNYSPNGRWFATLTYVHGRLFLIGGRDFDKVFVETNVYDIAGNSWSPVDHSQFGSAQELPTGFTWSGTPQRFLSHCTIIWSDKLYIIGGDQAGPAREIYVVEPAEERTGQGL